VIDVQHADVKYADACLRCLRTLVARRSTSCVDIIFSVSIFSSFLFASVVVALKENLFLLLFTVLTVAMQWLLSTLDDGLSHLNDLAPVSAQTCKSLMMICL